MTIEYNPRLNLLPQGDYDFYIVAAQEAVTKNGHPMLKVAFNVHDDEGKKHEIRDFIVINSSYIFKLEQFSQSIGHDFNSGEIDATDLINKKGRFTLKQELDENYGAKNRVSKYLKKNNQEQENHVKMNENIPF